MESFSKPRVFAHHAFVRLFVCYYARHFTLIYSVDNNSGNPT